MDGTFNMSGGSVYSNTANEYNAGIRINRTTMNLTGGYIYENVCSNRNKNDIGGGIQLYDSTLNINGGEITNNTNGGVYLNNSKLIMDGGLIDGNISYECGAGVYALNASSVNMTGGRISNNVSQKNGGGIYSNASTIVLSEIGGSHSSYVTNNTAVDGGGVYLDNKSTYSPYFATINSNTALGNGGGLYFTSTTILDESYHFGSSISSNTASSGGGIYYDGVSSVNLTASIMNNTATDFGGGVYFNGNTNISAYTLTLDNDAYLAKNSAGMGGAVYARFATVNVNGAIFGGSEGNGNTAGNGGVFFITNGKLNMTAGTMSYNSATSGGGAVFVGSTTPFNFSGGTITQNTAANGGGVYLSKGSAINSQGILNLTKDAEIIENTATSGGGGIYVNQGTANLTLGKVESNHAMHGGGLCIEAGTANLQGTQFTINTAINDGGAVFMNGGTATLSSSKLSSNSANYGGAVCVRETGSFTMTGGTISQNSAKICAGGVRATDSTVTVNLNGGTISENYVDPNQSDNQNQSWAHGGAIWVSNKATVNINGSTISNNYIINKSNLTSPYGGGIFISEQSTVNFRSGTIQGNLACASVSNNVVSFDSSNANSVGGNVFVSEECYFNMTGGTIAGRKNSEGNYIDELQAYFGGGVGNMGITSLTGGTIKNCNANYGGGVGSYGGIFVDKNTIANASTLGSMVSGLVGEMEIDLRSGKLTIGSVKIAGCEASQGVGSSIATGYELELKGSPDIDGEISLSALDQVYYHLNYVLGSSNVPLTDSTSKKYPEIYVSGNFTPVQQLQINFSQAIIEAKLDGEVNAVYNLTTTSNLMTNKFVDSGEVFISYASGVAANPSNFYVTTDGGSTKYVVVQYSDATINNSTFDTSTATYVETSHLGNALMLVSTFEINDMYKFTITEDQTAYTVGLGGGNGMFADYYDPNESAQTFIPRTATSSGLILTLPNTYNNKPVIGVTADGFKNSGVTSIVMQEGYTVIGDNGFYGCTSLTSVTIPSTMQTIGGNAFYGCSSLTGTITLPNVTSVGDFAFYNCSKLTGFSGTNNLAKCVTLGASAFRGLTNLTGTINLSNVTTVGEYAFHDCQNLSALNGTSNLAKATTIGESAFRDCTKLAGTIDFSKATSIGQEAFINCSKLTGTIVLSSATSIGSSAFNGCSGITSLTLGQNITSVGNTAFANMTGLTIVNYNATEMNDLPDSSFVFDCAGSGTSGCTINVGSNVTKIPSYLFYTYKDRTGSTEKKTANFVGTIDLTNVTSVGTHAFAYCTGLTTLASGSLTKATTIGNRAFWQCLNLAGVLNLSSAETISDWAFKDCTKITSITIGKDATYIGNNAFYNNQSVKTFNYNATNLGALTSAQASNLGSVNNCAITLSGNATFTIGANVESIPDNLFNPGNKYWNSGNEFINNGITSIVINGSSTTPSKLSSIGVNAFAGCSQVTRLTLPSYVETGELYIDKDMLKSFTSLKYLNFGDGVKNVTSKGGGGFEALNLSYVKSTLETVEMGTGITSIPANKFYQFTSLQNVTYAKGVTVGDYAFYGCSSMKYFSYVSISNSKSIGEKAFAYTKLSGSCTISKTTEKIGTHAFYGCNDIDFNLTSDSTSGRVGYSDDEIMKKIESGDFSQTWNLQSGSYNNGSGTWTAHRVIYDSYKTFKVTVDAYYVATKPNGETVTNIINPTRAAGQIIDVGYTPNKNILEYTKFDLTVTITGWNLTTSGLIRDIKFNTLGSEFTAANNTAVTISAGVIATYDGLLEVALCEDDTYESYLEGDSYFTDGVISGDTLTNWVANQKIELKPDKPFIRVFLAYSNFLKI